MSNFLNELLQTFRIADFFDIFIISLFLYVILVWFKATASRFVLLGIIIIGVVYIVARFFQMYLSAVVLQAFFAILIIALVVIFQEELRRFFERLSLWAAMRRHDEIVSGYPQIEILTRAFNELARKKTGVLVVLRGRDPLERHLEGGHQLDGRLSQALLESIFDPHSPGHDGAAVIERGRITKFGCHLPLSVDMKKIGALGTRHSAALGLAERSDAMCIVVSEERGTISVAYEEKLREVKDAARLQASLERFYHGTFPQREEKRTWTRWLRENSREKAVAFLFSCGLWFVFVFQTGTLRRDLLVPIEYRNLASDWVIEEPKPREATVTLLGRGRAFDLLDPRAVKITLDMSNIKPGLQEVQITNDMVYRPSSLSVVDIDPERIKLTAFQFIPMSLPVEVQTHGAVPLGKLAGIEVSPQSVPVMVSNKAAAGTLRALTEPINLDKVTQTTTLNPGLVLPAGTKFADQKPPKVDVKINVVKPEENSAN